MANMDETDLAPLIEERGCRYVVEDGLDNVEAMLESGLDLDQIYAIESNHKKALDLALRLAANHKVTIIHARLEKGLQEALLEMRPDRPAIFRLGSSAGEDALRKVAGQRDLSRDVILVGDDS